MNESCSCGTDTVSYCILIEELMKGELNFLLVSRTLSKAQLQEKWYVCHPVRIYLYKDGGWGVTLLLRMPCSAEENIWRIFIRCSIHQMQPPRIKSYYSRLDELCKNQVVLLSTKQCHITLHR